MFRRLLGRDRREDREKKEPEERIGVVVAGADSDLVDLFEELVASFDGVEYWRIKLKDSETGRRVLVMEPKDQVRFLFFGLDWLDEHWRLASEAANRGENLTSADLTHRAQTIMRYTLDELRRRKLPVGHDDLVSLYDRTLGGNYYRSDPFLVKSTETYLKENPLTDALRERTERHIENLENTAVGYDKAAILKHAMRLRRAAGFTETRNPLVPGEAFSDAVLADLEALEDDERVTWIALINLCAGADGARPSKGWSKESGSLVEEIGAEEFLSAVKRWFPLVDKPRTWYAERVNQWGPDPNQLINDVNANVIKGLVWICAGYSDADLARVLSHLALSAYRKVPQVGPRCVRVGNACVWALGDMSGSASIGQLAVLKVRVKSGTALKGIEKALDTVAEREGIPRSEVEEMSVPAYGVEEVGVRREMLGDFTAELRVMGTSSTELRWIKPDGKTQKSVPKRVREDFSEGLKELKSAAKDIQKLLPSQRDRIESLYLEEKSWDYLVWRERYLDHPLVGTLARRLIWTFSDDEREESAVWREDRLVDRRGQTLEWPGEGTRVELWHPIGSSTDEVLEWRDRLAEFEIRQPFKQAHREVYLLTDAERRTETYSNRFAAHILKQHQFNALCAARGWRNKLRLMVDDAYPPASRELAAHGIRAEYWIESIGDEYGVDTNESGTHLYVATDQVRFYPLDAMENYAHASGGGYGGPGMRWVDGRVVNVAAPEPLTLKEIPPLVFSEIMRDCDLFVGVASVGNDPNWMDGGRETRYRDYWSAYSFGDLSETAKTRKEVLERIVPRLRISDCCTLSDRFLVVRGELRTYRIHLGSGNILMEPNDQYLCIVPSSGMDSLTGKVYLPFEGDRTLAIILSKAFMLADDTKIEDPTILRQIRA